MIQAGIFNALKDDPAIAAKVADGSGGFNIYPFRIPDDILDSFEYFITYQRISETVDKNAWYKVTAFQINAISTGYNNCQELADDIINVLHTFYGNLGGQQLVERTYQVGAYDLFDPETNLYFVPIDFKFIYK